MTGFIDEVCEAGVRYRSGIDPETPYLDLSDPTLVWIAALRSHGEDAIGNPYHLVVHDLANLSVCTYGAFDSEIVDRAQRVE